MTKRQLELLQFIKIFIETNGYSPSYEEMKQAIGISSRSSVWRLVSELEAQGRVRHLHGKARTIELVKDPELPTLTYVPTGELASEARRRHLVLCHKMRDEFGSVVYQEIVPLT